MEGGNDPGGRSEASMGGEEDTIGKERLRPIMGEEEDTVAEEKITQ